MSRSLRSGWGCLGAGLAVPVLGALLGAQAIDVDVVYDRGGSVVARVGDLTQVSSVAVGARFVAGHSFGRTATLDETEAFFGGSIGDGLEPGHRLTRLFAGSRIGDNVLQDPAAGTSTDGVVFGPLSCILELRGAPGVLMIDVQGESWMRELGIDRSVARLDVDDDGSWEYVLQGDTSMGRVLRVPGFTGFRRVRIAFDQLATGPGARPWLSLEIQAYHEMMPIAVTSSGPTCGLDLVVDQASEPRFHYLDVSTKGAPRGLGVLALGIDEARFPLPSSVCDLLLVPLFSVPMSVHGAELDVVLKLPSPARGLFRMQAVVLAGSSMQLLASPRLDLRAMDP